MTNNINKKNYQQYSQDYRTWKQEELLGKLVTSSNGLSHEQAGKRLAEFGPNELAKKKKRNLVILFLSRFSSPLIIILIIASLISFILKDELNASIILVMILVSVVIEFTQRYRSEEAAEKLKHKISVRATVMREGMTKEIPLSHLVPGDIVFLSAGDIIPADCRLVESNYLFVNQSSLTGESMPVEKKAGSIALAQSSLSDAVNTVFFGTHVISGSAKAVVVRTALLTEFGKISQSLAAARPPTEFDRGIQRFSFLILQITLTLVVIVFSVRMFFHQDMLESFLFTVALAVGLTPEMLPMLLTLNLSRGALKMSKHGVIVKNLNSIQNFGSMDILCTDKTGTLTEGIIHLERYENIDRREDLKVLEMAYINSYFQMGLKSPLDEAVLTHHEITVRGYSKFDEVPFDFLRKRVSVIVKKDIKALIYTKGSVEGVLDSCTSYYKNGEVKKIDTKTRQTIIERLNMLSREGFRVLGVAFRPIEMKKDYSEKDEKDLIFMGLTAFYDPPKPSAGEGLEALRHKGIALKILTGDNELVTQKICRELGINVEDSQILISSQIDNLTDDALGSSVEKIIIFARLTPDQKNRVILALKKLGHVVGYLGDGINDAPSLRTADIGISVDNAVDVAKESADIILLTKSLHILSNGVVEGRKTYANIMKYILMGTSSNFGNMFSVAGASLFLPFLPMLPKQILLNNFLYDLSQISLGADNVDESDIAKPKKWNIGNVKKFMLIFGPISSLFDYLTFFLMLFIFHASIPMFRTAWFIESLTTQSLIIFSIRTHKSPFYKSRPKGLFILNVICVVVFSLILPFITPLSAIFSFVRPSLYFYLVLIFIVIVYFYLTGIAKRWYYQRHDI